MLKELVCASNEFCPKLTETLRLWTPVVALDRICIKDFNIGKPNKTATEDYIVSL